MLGSLSIDFRRPYYLVWLLRIDFATFKSIIALDKHCPSSSYQCTADEYRWLRSLEFAMDRLEPYPRLSHSDFNLTRLEAWNVRYCTFYQCEGQVLCFAKRRKRSGYFGFSFETPKTYACSGLLWGIHKGNSVFRHSDGPSSCPSTEIQFLDRVHPMLKIPW